MPQPYVATLIQMSALDGVGRAELGLVSGEPAWRLAAAPVRGKRMARTAGSVASGYSAERGGIRRQLGRKAQGPTGPRRNRKWTPIPSPLSQAAERMGVGGGRIRVPCPPIECAILTSLWPLHRKEQGLKPMVPWVIGKAYGWCPQGRGNHFEVGGRVSQDPRLLLPKTPRIWPTFWVRGPSSRLKEGCRLLTHNGFHVVVFTTATPSHCFPVLHFPIFRPWNTNSQTCRYLPAIVNDLHLYFAFRLYRQ